MELSIFLAKVIGIILIVVSLALLLNKKNIDLLFKLYSHPEPVFLTGMLEVVLGLVFVLNHNIWAWDFRGLITLIGWILLFRGAGRLFFPKKVANWVIRLKKMKNILTILLVFVFLAGLYLTYAGFTFR